MVALAFANRMKLNRWPVLVAGGAGLVVAGVMLAVPTAWLERGVIESGIAAIVSAAEPPLGTTARILVSLGGGIAVAAVILFGLNLLLGRAAPGGAAAAGPRMSVRRADAHPDAPPRAPLLATRDLGVPFLDVRAPVEDGVEPEPLVLETPVAALPLPPPDAPIAPIAPPAERPIPTDLDLPMAAFDPAAVPDVPAQPVRVPPLIRPTPRPAVLEIGERIETFELTPVQRAAPSAMDEAPIATPEPDPVPADPPITRPETDATIHALLERLERGVGRRASASEQAAPPARNAEVQGDGGLEAALDTLRRLARSG